MRFVTSRSPVTLSIPQPTRDAMHHQRSHSSVAPESSREAMDHRPPSSVLQFNVRRAASCKFSPAIDALVKERKSRRVSSRATGALPRLVTRPRRHVAHGGGGEGIWLRIPAAPAPSRGADAERGGSGTRNKPSLLKEWAAHTHPARRGGKPRRCQPPRAVGLADRDCARTRRTESEFGSAICAASGA